MPRKLFKPEKIFIQPKQSRQAFTEKLHCFLWMCMYLVFRHEERETQFLLCWLFLHRPSVNPQLDCPVQSQISTNWPIKHAAHPVAPSWTGLTQSQISTNCFFQKSPKIPAPCFQAWCHSHPSLSSYLGFLLWHLWLSYSLRASMNCTQCVHLHSAE